MSHDLTLLSTLTDVENKAIYKQLTKSHQALAELKGVAGTVPNQAILVSTLALQEAKDSSEIENIITTHDDLYRSDVLTQNFVSIAAKEVHHYAQALQQGFERVKQTTLLTCNDIIAIQAGIEENNAGFRKLAGTALLNSKGETIYTPPQNPDDIISLMRDLEQFINDDSTNDFDPLTKMAIIHHQFESIHPFYDGNGRTGRVINILYLVKEGLLDSPILYLSRYINQNKQDYYRLLQAVRVDNNWQEWILYMLKGVEQTALQTTQLIKDIQTLMLTTKQTIRLQAAPIYSQDLVNNLFKHPYTKIDFLVDDLQVHRHTATKYLDTLVELEMLTKHKLGKENYYINNALFNLLHAVGEQRV